MTSLLRGFGSGDSGVGKNTTTRDSFHNFGVAVQSHGSLKRMQTGARSARQLVREAAERLDKAGVPEPLASAEVLLAELLDARRSELAFREEPLTDEETGLYESWISRRSKREPVQRILGYAYFRDLCLE